MQNKFLILVAVLTCSLGLFAQDSLRFYSTIDTLCTPYFYGRGYENNGHIRAKEYLKARFLAADVVREEQFPFQINHFYDQMTLAFCKHKLLPCQDYIPQPAALGGSGSYKTIVLDSVFFTDQEQKNQFLAKNINHRAIIYSEKLEAAITSDKLLQKKIYSESGLIIKTISGETLKTFSEEAWMPPSFALRQQAIQGLPLDRVSFELSQRKEKLQGYNVIATLKGAIDTTHKIVICAHYDHVGGYQECYIPGANDNASGIAMMLELYQYFLLNRPTCNLEFIAFGGEELGLVGSNYHTRNNDLKNIKFVLNLDLIGAGSKGVTVVNATTFPNDLALLEAVNNEDSLVSVIKKRGEAANSDHYYFTKKGLRAFFIYSNGEVGGYHNINDVPQKLERGSFVPMFELFRRFLIKEAENQ
jgi:aminopeptidase YwaD